LCFLITLIQKTRPRWQDWCYCLGMYCWDAQSMQCPLY